SGRYAYLKGKEDGLKDHFLVSQDRDEITIVTHERNLPSTAHEDEVKWFKLFEFKVAVPFLSPGFLAKIAKTIADKGMNILIVSTFSKDYALIREADANVAIKALEEVGFSVEQQLSHRP
ncbi:MAG: ACT domain-containing protein, partial [Nanoarchaeota archaeon]